MQETFFSVYDTEAGDMLRIPAPMLLRHVTSNTMAQPLDSSDSLTRLYYSGNSDLMRQLEEDYPEVQSVRIGSYCIGRQQLTALSANIPERYIRWAQKVVQVESWCGHLTVLPHQILQSAGSHFGFPQLNADNLAQVLPEVKREAKIDRVLRHMINTSFYSELYDNVFWYTFMYVWAALVERGVIPSPLALATGSPHTVDSITEVYRALAIGESQNLATTLGKMLAALHALYSEAPESGIKIIDRAGLDDALIAMELLATGNVCAMIPDPFNVDDKFWQALATAFDMCSKGPRISDKRDMRWLVGANYIMSLVDNDTAGWPTVVHNLTRPDALTLGMDTHHWFFILVGYCMDTDTDLSPFRLLNTSESIATALESMVSDDRLNDVISASVAKGKLPKFVDASPEFNTAVELYTRPYIQGKW